ncbi:alpha/beta-hydrolase [Rhizoclosmatium globosum]|uniref:Alpha/beta-hydrolase n=1 Tax=Rhizoclosmatium globosum TaxID=329046 RepID=A0A1Y2C1C5_9FUNG|nr:alpha/beta-hydrolase [Rhizoclosmatium globosum]|eukprot:ORY40766.1 alpha/beta-hydrolase [Rhizoclosmatium globosum]
MWYKLTGTGPIKVIFIMGLNLTHKSWSYQQDYFSALPQYSTLVFDNRGVGYSDTPAAPYTTGMMAKDTLALLEWVGWTQGTVHIVGVSMGGMISQELALLAPKGLVASLSLVSTNAGRVLPPLGAVIGVPRLLVTKDVRAKLEGMVKLLFPQEWLDKDAWEEEGLTNREYQIKVGVERAGNTPLQKPEGALGQLWAALAHYVSEKRLGLIKDSRIPVLVATGTWDQLVNPWSSAYLARILEPRVYRVYEGAGHAIMVERSKEVNLLLQDFFEGAEKSISSRL